MSHIPPTKYHEIFSKQKRPISTTYLDMVYNIIRRIFEMFTNIVVLYTAYILNLPIWCKVLPSIALAINFIQFTYGIYKAGEKNK